MQPIRRPRRSRFEVSFGRPLDDDEEPLARAEPVEIDLGGGLTFRIAGRIDRIDQVGPDGVRGARLQDRRLLARQLDRARSTAAAVCSTRSTGWRRSNCCAAQHAKPTVAGGVYYFSSHKGRQERVRIPAPGARGHRAVLGDLRE